MKSTIVAPSVLSANFANLQADFNMLNESEAEFIHIDVMDGVFVPNISFGLPVVEAMRKLSNKVFDVHLMIAQPQNYIEDFRKAGADILTVHIEVCTHLHRTIQQIKNMGMKAGVALNPHTPVQLLSDIIADIDVVCIMSVNPGFGGQSFISNTYNKIVELKELIHRKQSKALIEVDGGVNIENAANLVANGVHILVAGNAIFQSNNPIDVIANLKKA